MICEYSKHFESQAQKYGFKVFSMDESFDDKLSAIENYFNKAIPL